ncbi:hypothetical protein KKD03_05630 [Patescibacteria group bacterium]|nr:hypothetical protein [Patescibacteria group bacterium]
MPKATFRNDYGAESNQDGDTKIASLAIMEATGGSNLAGAIKGVQRIAFGEEFETAVDSEGAPVNAGLRILYEAGEIVPVGSPLPRPKRRGRVKAQPRSM